MPRGWGRRPPGPRGAAGSRRGAAAINDQRMSPLNDENTTMFTHLRSFALLGTLSAGLLTFAAPKPARAQFGPIPGYGQGLAPTGGFSLNLGIGRAPGIGYGYPGYGYGGALPGYGYGGGYRGGYGYGGGCAYGCRSACHHRPHFGGYPGYGHRGGYRGGYGGFPGYGFPYHRR